MKIWIYKARDSKGSKKCWHLATMEGKGGLITECGEFLSVGDTSTTFYGVAQGIFNKLQTKDTIVHFIFKKYSDTAVFLNEALSKHVLICEDLEPSEIKAFNNLLLEISKQ